MEQSPFPLLKWGKRKVKRRNLDKCYSYNRVIGVGRKDLFMDVANKLYDCGIFKKFSCKSISEGLLLFSFTFRNVSIRDVED